MTIVSPTRGRRNILWIRFLAVLALGATLAASSCSSALFEISKESPPPPTAVPTASEDGEAIIVPSVVDQQAPTPAPPDDSSLGWPLDLAAPALPDDGTRLGISPDVRTGLLDNGLVYYVRSQAEPANALSLRLAVDAGSLQQREAESGLAHFVEHMLFNGTEAFPGNELDAVLQRLGAELGPDLNAYTTMDETVYSLDLQDDDPELYDVAFTVLREWSSRALFDPDEVAAERGVVREETRSYYTSATAELDTTFDDAYNVGTAYMGRFPGGRGDAVMAITPQQARSFYERWYRPDNMAIVAVGDYDVAELEATIVERFGDVPASDESLETVENTGSGWNDQVIIDTITSPSYARNAVSIDWLVPANPLGTVGDVERLVREQLLVSVLDERLSRLSESPESGLFEAGATTLEWNRHRSIIGLNAGTDDLLAATTVILSEFGAVAETGISSDEFQRAAEMMRLSLEQFAQQRVTNAQRADNYVRSFLVGSADIFEGDFVDLAIDRLDALEAQDVTNYWRFVAANTAPVVILISQDDEHAVSREQAASAVAAASSDQVGPSEDVAEIATVIEPPEAQEPSETVPIDGLDQPAHAWSYANGATVVYVESSIEPETFTLQSEQRSGSSQFSDAVAPLTDLAIGSVERSDLAGNSHASVERFAQDAQVQVRPYANAYQSGFLATGRASGLGAALQLLYAKVTRAEIDDTGRAGATRTFGEEARFEALDPATQARDELSRLRFGDGGAGQRPPDLATIDSVPSAELLSMYQTLVGGVDETTTFVIVGDLPVDDVRTHTDVYIANLPARAAATPIETGDPPIEAVQTSTITFGEPETSGELIEFFATTGEVGNADLVAAAVTADVLDQRLFDVVREEMSATYGGLVAVSPSLGPTTGLETTISFDADPTRLEEIRDRILEEISDLTTQGPSADELQRVQAVLGADWAYVSNGELYEQAIRAVNGDEALRWGSVGIGSVRGPEKIERLQSVSPDDVRQRAALLWPIDRRLEVLRVPDES